MSIKNYYPHDNGGRPFRVEVDSKNKKIRIYTSDEDDSDAEADRPKKCKHRRACFCNREDEYKHLRLELEHYTKVFIGRDPTLTDPKSKLWGLGNSLLIHREKNKYMFVGASVYKFKLSKRDEPGGIKVFRSPLGHSDVPYPFAKTSTKTIVFNYEGASEIDTQKIPLGFRSDPCTFYFDEEKLSKIEKRDSMWSNLEGEILVKRQK